MRRLARRAAIGAAVLVAVLATPGTASAHPLGNFTVNVYAGIRLAPGEIRVDYVVDMAEIPTVQLLPRIDADHDGIASAAERAAWALRTASELVSNVVLSIDGRVVELAVVGSSAALAAGQGGLPTLRLEAGFAAGAPTSGELSVRDANFEGRVGWREITVAGSVGVRITGSSVPARSATDALRSYPGDPLSSPLDVRDATATFRPGASAPAAGSSAGGRAGEVRAAGGGVFGGLVARTGPVMALALCLAFGLGAVHALGPGHGKTLMAGYLVGAGGRVRHAVAVGVSVAVMHTASVLVLGTMVLTLTEAFAPERVYPWLGLSSGLVALALGAGLLLRRFASRHEDQPPTHVAREDRATHAHPHPHGHHAVGATRPLSRAGLVALAVAGGILPSPTALVVLLAAVALERAPYGLALIVSFSAGLATALVLVGVLALRARDALAKGMSGRIARLVPVASAGAVAAMGLGLTLRGLAQV